MIKITVEVPTEDGEVIAKAIERVADAGDAALGLEFAAARRATQAFVSSGDSGDIANGWRAQQADALLAIAKASLAGGRGELLRRTRRRTRGREGSGAGPRRRQTTIRS